MTPFIQLLLLVNTAAAEEPPAASTDSKAEEAPAEEGEAEGGEAAESTEAAEGGEGEAAPVEGGEASEGDETEGGEGEAAPAEGGEAADEGAAEEAAAEEAPVEEAAEAAGGDESGARHGVTLGAGTLGATLSYVYAANMDCAISVQGHFFPVPESEKEINNTAYGDTTTLQGLSFLVHYHPLKDKLNFLRATGGLTLNASTIDLVADGEDYQIGNDLYDFSREVAGSVSFNALQPYFGLGTGINSKKGLGFFADLGMVYQGNPSAALEAVSEDVLGLEEDVALEVRMIEDAYSNVIIYPVIQLGAAFMF